jgi:D-alanyl-lipoteichoic acid acyltransferase DltB (MBOAT superfamily)
MLGIRLVPNFDNPYLSTSPTDFWRRWHMSLSYWFRDYVYIPLGGSRRGVARNGAILMLTFLLTGLWHGASWNFVIWGAYHGALILGHRALRNRVPEAIRNHALMKPVWVAQMFVLACIGWLMFRETDLSFLIRDLSRSPFAASAGDYEVAAYLFLNALVYSLPLWVYPAWQQLSKRRFRLPTTGVLLNPAMRVAAGAALFAGILLLRSNVSADFIYFQF